MIYRARADQCLVDHLKNTARLAKEFAGVFGCEHLAYFTGLLHDMGKYTGAFQDYLSRRLRGEGRRGEVIHALQGAKFVLETFSDPVMADIVGNAIATHHGGLFDNITDGERTISLRINKPEEELHYCEAKETFLQSMSDTWVVNDVLNGINADIQHICRRIQERNAIRPSFDAIFMFHLITKVLYSCLVDADRCDAAGIQPKDSAPNWNDLIRQLEDHLSELGNETVLEKIRRSISDQCREAGKHRPIGIYTLSVPTGGGKTLSSLRFALEHASTHKLKRIIYVIPYLSILDQTAAKLREIFLCDTELILEHHSNFELPGENDDEEEQYRLLTSRWDSPIILTTMVQFLETIYSNKASQLRKFHNMSEAVIIFDEIQSLPIKCVHLFNQAVNFLQTFGKSTVLLCTATQPHLHQTDRRVVLSEEPDIVNISSEEMKTFERVRIEDNTGKPFTPEEIAALVKEQLEKNKNTLVVLNTKRDARKVFEQCRSFECEKAFLTTDLCPAHRLTILDRLRGNLASKTRRLTLCVSTQLIEAGVDISFDCVIRAKAGMDSIVQAAGRCNRNKENQELQPVIVVDVQDEKLSRLPEILAGQNITTRIFHENRGKNLLCNEVMTSFYQYYFFEQQNGANKGKMDFRTRENQTTIFSLLSNNTLDTVAFQNRNNNRYNGLPCAFQTAANEFSVIDGGQTGIVVPYGDALQLVADFQNSCNPKEKVRILKQLQKYSVSVYSHTLTSLGQAIRAIDNTFYLLNPDYYDEEQGLLLEAKFAFLYV